MAVDLTNFNPNDVGVKSYNIFGLPFSVEDSEVILVPVPWEVTVSYRHGTSTGPENIFDASVQVDLYDSDVLDGWKKGFFMQEVDKEIRRKSDYLRKCSELIIAMLEEGGHIDDNQQLHKKLDEINNGSAYLNQWVYERSKSLLDRGKKVGIVGGEHSVPLGYIKALAEKYDNFGLLQIDAHADLREAYEGFKYSHASIMYNVLNEIPQVQKLVQVGIRDYGDDELTMIRTEKNRVVTFFDRDLKEAEYEGQTWKALCEQIVDELPQNVYISFDIDGLDPKLCPNTGTPVPGGFELEAIFYLFRVLHKSGRRIIGFDLNEVSCGQHSSDGIDAIVGARVLYKLCNWLVAQH